MMGTCTALWAADEVKEAEAQKQFEQAFDLGLKLKKRVEILQKVVSEYPESAWADDALWALGEIASRYGFEKYAVRFRQELVERKDTPKLERFTGTTWIYHQSRIPGVLWILERTGHRYRREKMSEKAIAFNPLPMVVNEDLALAYRQRGKPEEALNYYRKALTCAPEGGLFASIYQRRIKRLEEEIETKRKLLKSGQNAERGPDAAQRPQEAEEDKTGEARDRQSSAEKKGEEKGDVDEKK